MFIRKAWWLDVENFIPHNDDISEAVALNVDWKENLMSAVSDGDAVTLEHRGFPIAIGGNQGDQCWFVTDRSVSELTKAERYGFRKVIIEYRNKMLSKYPVLWNYVHVDNHNHIRFLKSIGAEFHEDATIELNGNHFIMFTIK